VSSRTLSPLISGLASEEESIYGHMVYTCSGAKGLGRVTLSPLVFDLEHEHARFSFG